jgi:hypothetical protein
VLAGHRMGSSLPAVQTIRNVVKEIHYNEHVSIEE